MTLSHLGQDGCEADALRNALRRRDYLISHELRLSSKEVALSVWGDTEHSPPHRCASDLRRSGQIFGVRHSGRRLHAACHFTERDGRLIPLEVVAALLRVLPSDDSGWTQAFWIFQPHGRLARSRPADMLESHPSDVLEAAEKEFLGDPGI